jgi:hypothetical protein
MEGLHDDLLRACHETVREERKIDRERERGGECAGERD